MSEPRLPQPIRGLLDGRDLRGKIGATLMLVAAHPEGWPRMALLSVGEVLAVSEREVLLSLYPGSRTTRALTASGKALLVLVHDGVTFKVRLDVDRADEAGDTLAVFRGRVVECAQDTVPYARLTRGIEYELLDEESVVTRWERQVASMRARAA